MRIKNFAKFQHFKDRRPPWVKLYRDLLDDPDWHELDAEASKVLVMLWLIASEDEEQNGNLPDMKKLAFRLRMDQKRLEKLCIKLSHWLERDDINAISERYQSDAPETETETETERETYKPEAEKSRDATASRLPADWFPSNDDVSFCEQERPDLKPSDVACRFRDYWIAQPGAKGRKLDWSATWRNWVRNEKRQTTAQQFTDKRQERDSAFLSAIGMSTRSNERVITGEVLP